MYIKKLIVRKLLERWIAKEPDNHIQGVMNKAKVLLWEEGRCQVGLELEEQHTNSGGTLHTGMAILIADVTCALALFSHPRMLTEITFPPGSLTVPSTVNLNFSFLNMAASSGDRILVEANIRTIKFNERLVEQNDFYVSNGPLASLNVVISNAESNILVSGNMLMHIEALAKDNNRMQ